MKILLTTNNHLGDAVVLTAAIHNAKAAFPDIQFAYEGRYRDVFLNNPDVSEFDSNGIDVKRIDIRYTPFSLRKAEGGNLCEGVSRNLSNALMQLTGRGFDTMRKTPYLCLSESEARSDTVFQGDYCILNANCQTCSEVKGYPFFQNVIDSRKDMVFVQIGGNETRDISQQLLNVIDYRGRTSIRELFQLVRHARCVLSPPSGVVHIAAAFNVRSYVITGAREPVKLTEYPNTRHFTSSCGRYSSRFGCLHYHLNSRKSCENIIQIENRIYAGCMCDIQPEEVARCLD